LTIDSLQWLVSGYLSKAFERGFQAGASTPNVPLFAQTFMINLLANYAQDLPVPVTELPYWLLSLGHAISPKSVPFGQGKVSYTFTLEGTFPLTAPLPFNQPIGAIVYPYKYIYGNPSGATINSFPVAADPGGTYSDQAGASAFQELCQFMQNNNTSKELEASRMVPSSAKTSFLEDVSVFALFTQAEGLGATGGGGGIYGQLQLEVPIFHPILALFASGMDTTVPAFATRCFNWALPISGDPCLLGAMMSSCLTEGQLSARRNHRFKAIDFLEFGDVVAQWVQQIVQALLNDSMTYTGQTPAAVVLATACPITLQEMLLLLRNTIMGAFKDSQSAVQGIYPFPPVNAGDKEFVPYTASSSTCSLNTLDMHLPIPLIENIRALTSRVITHAKNPDDVIWYLPVLGQYNGDKLDNADYAVSAILTVGDDPVFSEVFKSGYLFEKIEFDAKGLEVKTNLLEAAISLVDGSSAGEYAFINDPATLKSLCSLWNTWIDGSGVSAYSTGLGTYGTEKGINVLCSISTTRIWQNQGGFRRTQPLDKKKPSSTSDRRGSANSKRRPIITDLRFKGQQWKSVTNTPYATRVALIDVSQGEILGPAYEQVLSTWILPINLNEIIGDESTVIQRWQFMFNEPDSVSRSSGEDGINLSNLHRSYAMKMTRSKLAPTDDWTSFFAEMSRLGRGGILTGIVAGLVGKAFPGAAGIADSVASLFPF